VVGLLPEYADVSGSVRLHGDELLGLSDNRDVATSAGKTIGMVFQDPMSALTPVYTVGDQIAEALEVHDRGIGKRPREPAPSNCSSWSASPNPHAAPAPSHTNSPAANASAW
jgi:ABC-type microcin C transport system duplicated ATPase subunit YejF